MGMGIQSGSASSHDIRDGWFLLARLTAYALLASLAVHAAILGAGRDFMTAGSAEFGPIDIAQTILAGLGFVGFVAAARAGDDTATVSEIAAASLLFVAIYSLNHPLALALGQGTHLYFGAPVLGWGLFVTVRSRQVVAAQVASFVRSPGGFLMMFGAFFIAMYAGIAGPAQMTDHFRGIYALPGYFFFAFAALEAILRARDARRRAFGLR